MSPRVRARTAELLAKPLAEVIGRHPHDVRILERPGKDFEIYLRYKDPAKVAVGARDPRTWKATGLRARDALGARWDKKVLAEARQLANDLELALRTPRQVTEAPAIASAPATESVTLPLSISAGIAMATVLDGTGMVSVPLDNGHRSADRVTNEIIMRSRTLLRVLAKLEAATGAPALTWDSFTPVHADFIVRTLADEHVATGSHGYSVAIKMLDEFYRMSRWLKDKQAIAQSACIPRDKWKVKAKKEWVRIAGIIAHAHRPRHSEAEMCAIFAALDDPRGRLAMLFHRGVRLSLFADRRWSDLRLERTTARPHGGILVREAENNEYVRRLDEAQRDFLDAALSAGYLRRYEAARAAGQIADFFLFPEGRLVSLPEEPAGLSDALVVDCGARPLMADGPNVLSLDPRNRLAVELGAALRLGQVYRTMRSQVDMNAFLFLDADGPDAGVHAAGFVDVKGRGNKTSHGIALNSVTRHALQSAFSGYLSEFETLYLAGEIEDYCLFPAGRLIAGVAMPNAKYAQRPATRDAALGWFHELEAVAGVQRVRGRAWYGLRRIVTDVATKYTSNEMTLNVLSATSTAMRNQVYQDQEREEAKVDAARVQQLIRTGGQGSGDVSAPSALLINRDLMTALSRYSPEEIQAAIGYLDAQRAVRSGSSSPAATPTNTDEKTESVDPAVDPNQHARVHLVDPGVLSADLET